MLLFALCSWFLISLGFCLAFARAAARPMPPAMNGSFTESSFERLSTTGSSKKSVTVSVV